MGSRLFAFRFILLAIAAFALFAACSKDDHPTRPGATVEDPRLVVLRFRDAWVQRDTTKLASTLALTFGYGLGCSDSTGALFLYSGPDRDSTKLAAARLFRLGSASHPPATTVEVTLDSLRITIDPHDPVYRRAAFCSTSVQIRTAVDTLRLGGMVGFGLVRGDVIGTTVPPDSTRWFIGGCIEVVLDPNQVPMPMRAAVARRALLEASRLARAPAVPSSIQAGSAECDSLRNTTWSYALRRYLD